MSACESSAGGSAARVLVAGIGNIFQGDDAFGVEVVRRLSQRSWPEGVCVRDFGIRGFDVAYALNEPWETAILVDALSRGGEPGTVFVLEPNLDSAQPPSAVMDIVPVTAQVDPHGMDPVQAIRLAKSLGSLPARLLVVGCEPANLGGEDGAMGLSPEVQAAVDVAAETVVKLVTEALALAPC